MERFFAILIVLTFLACPTLAEELRRGDRGEAVAHLQTVLGLEGYSVGNADGDFGARTEEALRAYQRAKGLPETGVYDAATRESLEGTQMPMRTPTPIATPTATPLPKPEIHGYAYYTADCDWQTANVAAAELGGHLVTIESMAEYTELQSEIQELGYSKIAFWIGGRIGDTDQAFHWVRADGLLSESPIDLDVMKGVNPWALLYPVEWKPYMRMLFSSLEGRWVWENAGDENESDFQRGYIVEFDEDAPLYPGNVPNDFALDILGMEGDFVVVRLTTWADCLVQLNFWDDAYEHLYCFVNEPAVGGIQNRLMRIALDRQGGEALPEHFNIEGTLYDAEGGEYVPCSDWTECRRYLAQPVGSRLDSVRISKADNPNVYGLWRVTPVWASAPTGMDPGTLVEIREVQTGQTVVRTVPGRSVYLSQGVYTAHFPSSDFLDTQFTVDDEPVQVVIQDQPFSWLEGNVMDAVTQTPLRDMELTLELQGKTYVALTNAEGYFFFGNLPAAEGQLSLVCESSSPYAPQTEIVHASLDGEAIHLNVVRR